MPCIFGTNKPQTVKFNIFGSQTSKRWWCCLLPWYKLILSKSNITGTDGGATPLMRSWYSFSLLSKQVMLYLVHKKDVVNKIKINVFFLAIYSCIVLQCILVIFLHFLYFSLQVVTSLCLFQENMKFTWAFGDFADNWEASIVVRNRIGMISKIIVITQALIT